MLDNHLHFQYVDVQRGLHDVFVEVINFLSTNWEPKCIIVGLFDANDTSSAVMTMKLKHILNKFAFMHKIVANVKDEGSNLQTCVQALKVVVSCGHLNITEPFDGYCFGHVLLKVG
jgi:hypothetical protein